MPIHENLINESENVDNIEDIMIDDEIESESTHEVNDNDELDDLSDIDDVYEVDIDVVEIADDSIVIDSLKDFFEYYKLNIDGDLIQIFQSFSYGEMVIALLLLCILLVISAKWIYEVIRW